MASNEHPTPQHLLAHFMDTVADYERLQKTNPMPTTINVGGHRDDDSTRWNVILHALLLRKYFGNDQLELQKVARALRQCVVANDYTDQEWEAIYDNVGRYETISVYGAERLTETDILTRYLYGRYLHGDFGKWSATEGRGHRLPDGAIWSATLARADRVILLANLIRAGVGHGSVVYAIAES